MSHLLSRDHRVIGRGLLVVSFGWLLAGGLLAMVLRAELWSPGTGWVDDTTAVLVGSLHGRVLAVLFAVPAFLGFATALVPLQVGAPNVTWPWLSRVGSWLYVVGGVVAVALEVRQGAAVADFGWFAYEPLATDLPLGVGDGTGLPPLTLVEGAWWAVAVGLTLLAVSVAATVLLGAVPEMTPARFSVFTWGALVTAVGMVAVLVVLVLGRLGVGDSGPRPLTGLLSAYADGPGAVLVAVPFLGIVSEVLAVFARRRLVWAGGAVVCLVVLAALPLVAVIGGVADIPAGLAVLVVLGGVLLLWVATLAGGSLSHDPPLLWVLGAWALMAVSVLVGLVVVGPNDVVADSTVVVAQQHYLEFGPVLMGFFAGCWFWWPKLTGRMLSRRLGQLQFWLLFVGFQLAFLAQLWLGMQGMPRRYYDYLPEDGFTGGSRISSVGGFLMGLSLVLFLVAAWRSRRSPLVDEDDPWGWGRSLEWATACPAPEVRTLPPIRSDAPAFDLHHRGTTDPGP